LNKALNDILSTANRRPHQNLSASLFLDQWRVNAVSFGKTADIYSMPERAAQIILGK